MLENKVIESERAAELLGKAPKDLQNALRTEELLSLMVKLRIIAKPNDFWKTHKARDDVFPELYSWKLEHDRTTVNKAREQEIKKLQSLKDQPLEDKHASALDRVEAQHADPAKARRASLANLAAVIPLKEYRGDKFGTAADEDSGGYADGLMYVARNRLMDDESRKDKKEKEKDLEKEGSSARYAGLVRRASVTGGPMPPVPAHMSKEHNHDDHETGSGAHNNQPPAVHGGASALDAGSLSSPSAGAMKSPSSQTKHSAWGEGSSNPGPTGSVPPTPRGTRGNNELADQAAALTSTLGALTGDFSYAKAGMGAGSEVEDSPSAALGLDGLAHHAHAHAHGPGDGRASPQRMKSSFHMERMTSQQRVAQEREQLHAMLAVLDPKRTPAAALKPLEEIIGEQLARETDNAEEAQLLRREVSASVRGLGPSPTRHRVANSSVMPYSSNEQKIGVLARFGVSFKDVPFSKALMESTPSTLVEKVSEAAGPHPPPGQATGSPNNAGMSATTGRSPGSGGPLSFTFTGGNMTNLAPMSGARGPVPSPSSSGGPLSTPGSLVSEGTTSSPGQITNGRQVHSPTRVVIPLDRAPTKLDLYYQPVDPTEQKTVLVLDMSKSRSHHHHHHHHHAHGVDGGDSIDQSIAMAQGYTSGTGARGRGIYKMGDSRSGLQLTASLSSEERCHACAPDVRDFAAKSHKHNSPPRTSTANGGQRASSPSRPGTKGQARGSPKSPGYPTFPAADSSGRSRGSSAQAGGFVVGGHAHSQAQPAQQPYSPVLLQARAAQFGASPVIGALGVGTSGADGGTAGYTAYPMVTGGPDQGTAPIEYDNKGDVKRLGALGEKSYQPETWGIQPSDPKYDEVSRQLGSVKKAEEKQQGQQALARTYDPKAVASMGKAWGLEPGDISPDMA